MKTYSQAGQDIFVRLILGEKPGTFLDIGCAGDVFSNTKALEEEGWTGWLIDVDPNAAKGRKNPFFQMDVRQGHIVPPFDPDYLSLDVDEASLSALLNIPLKQIHFKVITIEHDAYRFGNALREGERASLMSLGYQLVCKDVCATAGNPFEDWWVDPAHAAQAAKFASQGKLYTDILAGYL